MKLVLGNRNPNSPMRIAYFIRNIGVSGGVKVVLQHVKMLKEEGYDAALLAEQVRDSWGSQEKPLIVQPNHLGDLSDFDIVVASAYNDVRKLYGKGTYKLVHLCQGYEPVDYLSRITGEAVTERYQRRGLLSAIESWLDIMKFNKRIRQIESIYALPTRKAAVSRHLVDLIEGRYGQECSLIQNGIDLNVFRPSDQKRWGKDGRIRIMSVGSADVGFKGIPDTLDAVQLLGKRGFPVELIRVSPGLPSRREKESGLIHTFYTGLKEDEMANLYREMDIFVSSSLEGEGFGLPAIEAMASGVPTILTKISTYKNFDDRDDFACFVPTHNPEKIADGIERLANDMALRNRCIERGLEVARRFSLERTKQDLIDFVEKLRMGQ